MLTVQDAVQVLLSLPPRMAREFEQFKPVSAAGYFATSDPGTRRLGSGGGTAHLLVEAWRRTGKGVHFAEWLHPSRKLMIHGGGYMLTLAKDDEAARRVRQVLTDNSPNARARFAGLSLSNTGFQVTCT